MIITQVRIGRIIEAARPDDLVGGDQRMRFIIPVPFCVCAYVFVCLGTRVQLAIY